MPKPTRKKITADFNETVKLEPGQEFSGILLEKRIAEVEGETRPIYTFQKEDGSPVDMWGSGQLNLIMAKVPIGAKTFIKRVADVPSPTFKGSMMKTFEVEIEL